MAVEIKEETKPGDLYIDETGRCFELESFCVHPTATVRLVGTDHLTGGAVGSRNLENFMPVNKQTKEQLIRVIGNQVHNIRTKAVEIEELKRALDRANEDLNNEKLDRLCDN